ncbi:small secreted protein [Pseudomassariella vexata]|uniref:Small secreted protein n=1 Tax=Pseudomassariella vexata TaxID=1141098 RepID=A0A1Y2E9X8_9PEZI|nr:small secreted protein [Pseudomassariella vexata]ORY68359.1 small secreted protein [Pseudomassariella vexata]
MRFTAVIVAAVLPFDVMAAPAPDDKAIEFSQEGFDTDVPDVVPADYDSNAEVVNMMADCSEWTIRHLKRTCNRHDTSCCWDFAIDTGHHDKTHCSFTIEGHHASRTDISGVDCGPFTVSAGWSGQFGEDNGFYVLSVVDYEEKLIVWPGYTDEELGCNGKVVRPNKSYAPARIPGY